MPQEKIQNDPLKPDQPGWKLKWYVIIFESDTRGGKNFDLLLMITILLSVIAVMMESIREIRMVWGKELLIAEWIFTLLFAAEYTIRVIVVKNKAKYIFSFLGIIDLLSVLPTFISLLIPWTHSLLIIRILRLLRVFRILKLTRHLKEASTLGEAMRASVPKILVFILTVLSLTVIFGTIMYLIEGSENGYTSIPTSIYWCIVTLTTVGYGDITPLTAVGKFIASFIMLLGYGIIAVPTGIVSVELGKADRRERKICNSCQAAGHLKNARFCYNCGSPFESL